MTISHLISPPWQDDANLAILSQALKGQFRFIGGCVRDALLKRPVTDIDLATPLLPEEVTQHLETAQIKAVPTGIRFGTITAVVRGQPFEITTLREDLRCDGRHAHVTFTTDWQKDASRRDFTINAISCDIDGKLYDYFGGMEDIKQRRIRFIGNPVERCHEDYLRILRFFRFYASHGKGEVDQQGLDACCACKEGIATLSGERLHDEMLKLLASADPMASLALMRDYQLNTDIMPIPPSLGYLKAWMTTLNSHQLEQTNLSDPILRLCTLIRQTDRPLRLSTIEKTHARLRFSKKEYHILKTRTLSPASFATITKEKPLKRLIRKLGQGQSLDLIALELAEMTNKQQISHLLKHYQFTKSWHIPTFPIQGKDLLALGMRPGKSLGDALTKAEQWWESNDYQPDKATILKFLETQKL